MAKDKVLSDLFLDTLKDIYFAEKKILSALPKMAKAAQSPKLKAAFEKHMGETEGQVDRLEQVFASIDESPKGKTCDAIMGILDEGKEIMDEYKGTPALDAGLLAAAQAVEHYEISRYGTLKTWAERARLQGCREAARCDAEGREEHRQHAQPDRRDGSQPARGNGASRVKGADVPPFREAPVFRGLFYLCASASSDTRSHVPMIISSGPPQRKIARQHPLRASKNISVAAGGGGALGRACHMAASAPPEPGGRGRAGFLNWGTDGRCAEQRAT